MRRRSAESPRRLRPPAKSPAESAIVPALPARRQDDASREQLLHKYEALCRKYSEAVAKLEARAATEAQSAKLAWWALRTSGSGLALIRDGRITASNPRWAELCGRRRAHWSLREDGGKRQPASERQQLWQIALELAAPLADRHAPREIVAVFESDADDLVVELRLERSLTASGPPPITAIAHDVTQRVRDLEELDRARETLYHRERMQAIGEMASGVAHDLNNTLHVMGLRIQMIATDEEVAKKHGRHLQALQRIIQDAGKTVGRLQDFAQRRRDRPLGVVDLAAVLAESLDLARTDIEEKPQLEGRTIKLEAELQSVPTVRGNADELRPVFMNLVLNARDAMPEGGVIRCRTEVAPTTVTAIIEDDGTGIAPQNLTKIFDPFFTTKGRRGTGLGLSMAYGVVTRLGGTIAAENRPEGGARFRLVFPRADAPNVPAGEDRSTVLLSQQRVLIVDDEPENLSALQELLESAEQRVEVAHSGAQAIALARTSPRFDLVLCDVGMPGLSGWQVADELRRLDPDARIYLLTGWANEISDEDPRRATVSGVLGKPVDVGEIKKLLGAPAA